MNPNQDPNNNTNPNNMSNQPVQNVPVTPIQNPAPQVVETPSPQPASFTPNQGPAPVQSNFPPQPKSNKLPLIIGGAVLLVVIIAVAVILILNGSKKTSSNSTSSSSSSSSTSLQDVMNRTDGTLQLGSLIGAQSTIKAQSLAAKMNQQVNLSDGVSFMVTKVTRNFVNTDPYGAPVAGKELVKIDLVVGNRDKINPIYNSYYYLKNPAGGLIDPSFVDAKYNPDVFSSSVSIEPGTQKKVSLIFTVDKGEKVSFVYSADYENYTTQKKITVYAEVTLQ